MEPMCRELTITKCCPKSVKPCKTPAKVIWWSLVARGRPTTNVWTDFWLWPFERLLHDPMWAPGCRMDIPYYVHHHIDLQETGVPRRGIITTKKTRLQ
jgi:hypothetical protein